MSGPSFASKRREKFRNLIEIYEKNEVDNTQALNYLFALFSHVDDLIHFEDVVMKEKRVAPMNEEMREVKMNDTWELVNLLKEKEVIGFKWVCKTRNNVEGNIEIHKERLFVRGYKKNYRRNHVDTFAPIARMETLDTVLSIFAQHR